ncbi:MAG: hypothetical protein ACT4PT_14555 [Methanobacteriota archaeon]
MSLNLDAVSVVNWTSGLAMIALGVAVLAVRPRRRANVALSVLLTAFGFTVARAIVSGDDLLRAAVAYAAAVGFSLMSAAFVALALLVPRPLQRGERRLLVFPVLASAAFAAATAAMVVLHWGAIFAYSTPFATSQVVTRFERVGLFFLLAVLAARFARLPERADSERSQIALMSAALVLSLSFTAGVNLGFGADTYLTEEHQLLEEARARLGLEPAHAVALEREASRGAP